MPWLFGNCASNAQSIRVLSQGFSNKASQVSPFSPKLSGTETDPDDERSVNTAAKITSVKVDILSAP